jgi:hypothetical protein
MPLLHPLHGLTEKDIRAESPGLNKRPIVANQHIEIGSVVANPARSGNPAAMDQRLVKTTIVRLVRIKMYIGDGPAAALIINGLQQYLPESACLARRF